MFRLLRHFSIASGILIVLATLVLALVYREAAIDQAVTLTEEKNRALTRVIANTLWPRFVDHFETLPSYDNQALRADPHTGQLDAALRRLTDGLPVLRAKIYDLAGRTIYSSEPAQMGETREDNPRFQRAARAGEAVSTLIYRDRFDTFDGTVVDRDMVSTYLPLRIEAGPVRGVLELYTDITPVTVRIDRRVATMTGWLLAVFAGLYGVLFLIVRRADRILAQQYTELQDVRDQLRVELEERDFHVRREMAEREVAETVLGESGRRFRDFMETSSDWYWEMDEGLHLSYLSDRYAGYAGVAPDRVLGLTHRDLGERFATTEDWLDTAKWQAHFADLEARRPFRNLVIHWARPDGEQRVFLLNGRPVFDAGGTFLGYRGTGADITDLRRTEAALQASEERFRIIADYTHDWETWFSTDGRPLWINPAVERLAGYTVEECQAMDDYPMPIVHEEDRPLVARLIERGCAGERGNDIAFRIRTRQGESRWVAMSWQAVTSEAGDSRGWRASIRDISERHATEEALIRTMEGLANAQRIARLGNWAWDLTGDGRLEMSRETRRILGLDQGSGGEGLEAFLDRVHADDRESLRRAVDRAALGGEPLQADFRVLPGGAEERLVHAEAEVEEDESGRPQRLSGTLHDVTDLRRTEEALRESRERYALALQGANDGIWDWDLRSDRLYVSGRLLSIFGLEQSADPFTPETWRSRVHPEDLEKFTSRFQMHLRGETDFYSCEYRIRRPSGDHVWVLDRAVALRDTLGRAYRVAGSLGDVTTRRLAEDRLRHTQKMEALGKLAGGIAHEFNNLLVGIGGFAHMAVDRIDDPARVRFCLDEVIKAADKAAGLTGDLLAFSRQRAAQPTVLTLGLDEVVDDTANLLKTLVGKSVTLAFEYAEAGGCVAVDPSQLAQVVTNLAINARDAMPDGGTLTIGTRVLAVDDPLVRRNVTTPEGDWGCIYVRDTGTGIDKDTLKHIFEPFFTTKETGKGTGLGLAMVYGTIEQAGGFVDVESAPGEGTTFFICLPLTEPEEGGAVPDTVTETVAADVAPRTILLAEDDEAVRALAQQALADLGHRVLAAPDGRAALELARATDGPIDLLLTDLVMPGMGGRDLAAALTSERPETRVMLMTAHPEEGAGLDEADDLIRKPFTPAELSRRVQAFLAGMGSA